MIAEYLTTVGACVSPDPIDNEDAKIWFNCVEEMVFTDDDFCRDIDPPPVSDPSPINTLTSRRKLQALQAAYVVCLYQNWEGTDASKRRIRRHRFSTVVSVRSFPRHIPPESFTDRPKDSKRFGYRYCAAY
jgi:hypothetical protein